MIMHSIFGKNEDWFYICGHPDVCKHCYWEKFIHKHAYASSRIHVSKSDFVCVQGQHTVYHVLVIPELFVILR